MTKKLEHEEIRKELTKLILQEDGEFTMSDIRKNFFIFEYFKLKPTDILTGKLKSDEILKNIPKGEWDRVGVYASNIIKELERAGKIKFIREEPASRGSWKKKYYKVIR